MKHLKSIANVITFFVVLYTFSFALYCFIYLAYIMQGKHPDTLQFMGLLIIGHIFYKFSDIIANAVFNTKDET